MTAFESGANARRRDELRTANPYPKDSSEWIAWDMGWLDLDQHFKDRDDCLDFLYRTLAQ